VYVRSCTVWAFFTSRLSAQGHECARYGGKQPPYVALCGETAESESKLLQPGAETNVYVRSFRFIHLATCASQQELTCTSVPAEGWERHGSRALQRAEQ
jgi:hypothetical protein